MELSEKTSTMQKKDELVNRHLETILAAFNKARHTLPIEEDAYMATLFYMYFHHKDNIKMLRNKVFSVVSTTVDDEDPIALYLSKYVRKQRRVGDNTEEIEDLTKEIGYTVKSIDKDEFEQVYPDILLSLVTKMFESLSKYDGGMTPSEVSELIAHIVKSNGCTSVYDPFCGTAYISKFLSRDGIAFTGQEIDSDSAAIARLVSDAFYGKANIIENDSLASWSEQTFDAVATCAPSGLRLKSDIQSNLNVPHGRETHSYQYEDILCNAPFTMNGAKVSVNLFSYRFCNNSRFEGLRRQIVEDNLLDMVIRLPDNILLDTTISTVLVVCKKGRAEDEPVRFIDASDMAEKKRHRCKLLTQDIIGCLNTNNKKVVRLVSREQIRNIGYILSHSVYSVDESLELSKGQTLIPLVHIIARASLPSKAFDGSMDIIKSQLLHSELIPILLDSNKTVEQSPDERQFYGAPIRYIPQNSGKKYLLECRLGRELFGFSVYTSDKAVFLETGISVYEINDDVIRPEYLAYLLTKEKMFLQNPLHALMGKSIVLDSMEKQADVINRLTSEYHQKVRMEQQADAERLGIKQNVSDVEHMLGATQVRIASIISRLEEVITNDNRYPGLVKDLKDNFEYFNRVLHYNSAQIDSKLFNRQEGDLMNFLKEYAEGWENYGGEYFRLTITDLLPGECPVSFDEDMLKVMLDSILTNAARHGFHKNCEYTDDNRVEIAVSLVHYKEKQYVRLRISNNGDPISEGFTVEDYISRGRFTSKSGRSGLGGYHVHEIIKGHDGYMNLDSNKVWNMIVNLLLPVSKEVDFNSEQYEQDCI